MFWVCVAFIGSIAYILLAIIPHSLISLLSGSGKLAQLDARYWARWALACEALMEAVYKTIQFSYKGPRNFGSTKAAVQDGALLPHCQPTLGYGLQPKF